MIHNGNVGYQAPKAVFLPGPKLFCVHTTFNIFTALYIGVYSFFWRNGHLAFEEATTTHHVQLEHPTQGHCDSSRRSCSADFRSLNVLNYCTGGSVEAQRRRNLTAPDVDKLECHYMDYLANAVSIGDDNMLATTYVTTIEQAASLDCLPTAANDYTCLDTFDTTSESEFYVADIERFWLIIDHTVEVAEFNIAANAWEAPGSLLYDDGGRTVQEVIPQLEADGVASPDMLFFGDVQGDHIQLGELLRSASIDLDRNWSAIGMPRRKSGLIVQVSVKYSNSVPGDLLWGDGITRYTYDAKVTKTPLYQVDSLRASRDMFGALATNRLQFRKRGVYFDIVVSGRLGKLSVAKCLLTMVSAMAIVSASQYITGMLAKNHRLMGPLRAEKNHRALVEMVELPTREEFDAFEHFIVARTNSTGQDVASVSHFNPLHSWKGQDSGTDEESGSWESESEDNRQARTLVSGS